MMKGKTSSRRAAMLLSTGIFGISYLLYRAGEIIQMQYNSVNVNGPFDNNIRYIKLLDYKY